MDTSWDTDLAGFLTDLSAVQDESLDVLSRKRELLVADDREGLTQLAKREEALIERLQACLARRQELLTLAADQGLPSDSIRSLTAALPKRQGAELAGQVEEATAQARLLRHHSLTNWLLVQRTLIHLSQILEIIATGGRQKPTYGREESVDSGGTLVDHTA